MTSPSLIGCTHNGVTAMTGASTTYYAMLGLGGTVNGNNNNTSEANAQITHRFDATISRLAIYVGANSRATNSTLKSRKNGADGNMSVSITASTTGWFEDVTNSDTVTAGDTYNAAIVTGTGTSAWTWYCIRAMYEPTANARTYLRSYNNGSIPNLNSDNTTFRCAVNGAIGVNLQAEVNDNNARLHCRVAGSYSNFICVVTSNTRSTDCTAGIRKNGSAGNNVVTIPATTTGTFEDTTNTDVVSNADNVSYYFSTSTGGGSAGIRYAGCIFTSSGENTELIVARETTAQSLTGTPACFGPIFGQLNGLLNTTQGETNAQVKMPFDGRLSNLRCTWSNNNTNTTTISVRKNGADGNMSVSCPAATTGMFEDSSSHDDFVEDDLLAIQKLSGGASSHSINMISMVLQPPFVPNAGTGGGLLQVVS